MRAGLPSMKNVLTLLGKIILVTLGFMAAGSATYAAIQKEILGSGITLVFLNEEMNDMTKFLEVASLLIKGVTKSTENQINELKGRFWLLGMLGATLSANMLAGNAVVRGCDGVIGAAAGTNRSDQDF